MSVALRKMSDLRAAQGHTAFNRDLWVQHIVAGGSEVPELLREKRLHRLRDGSLCLDMDYRLSVRLAYQLKRSRMTGVVRPPPKSLDESQAHAWRAIFDNVYNTQVLVGGPGTGKSFFVSQMAKVIPSLAIATPTARAAAVCKEYLGDTHVEYCGTIHSLLGWAPGSSPTKTPEEYDWLIVDEASMADDEVLATLLDLLHPRTRVLLVGDPDQLPPVAPGAPLATLGSMVRTVRLNINHRAAGSTGIPYLCETIRRGATTRADLLACPSFSGVVPKRDFENELFENIPGSWGAGHQLVLYPLRDESKFKTTVSSLNRHVAISPGNGIQIGDRVVGTKNDRGYGVINGMFGVVEDATQYMLDIKWDGGSTSTVPRGTSCIDYGYVQTVYKAQGAQADHVTLALHPKFASVYTRQQVYTALTRAKSSMTCFGPERVLLEAIRRHSPRVTALSSLLTMNAVELEHLLPSSSAPEYGDE